MNGLAQDTLVHVELLGQMLAVLEALEMIVEMEFNGLGPFNVGIFGDREASVADTAEGRLKTRKVSNNPNGRQMCLPRPKARTLENKTEEG